MIANDLQYVAIDTSGRRVCEMALSTFADTAVKLGDTIAASEVQRHYCSPRRATALLYAHMKIAALLIQSLHERRPVISNFARSRLQGERIPEFCDAASEMVRVAIQGVAAALAAVADDQLSMPPPLQLAGPATASADDPALVQFRDHACWEVEPNEPNPGEVPIDLSRHCCHAVHTTIRIQGYPLAAV